MDYYFCDGRTDPCYVTWTEKNLVVFHWRWVSNVLLARFPLPIAPYVLNGGGRNSAANTALAQPRRARDEERPLKIARRTSLMECSESVPLDEGISGITLVNELSGVTLVDEPRSSSKKAVKIPFIDFRETRFRSKRPGGRLRIEKVYDDTQSALRRKSRQHITLPFRHGNDQVPRLSMNDARECLKQVEVTMSTVVRHNQRHLGKTLRCGYCIKS